ncbi:hypothetical protein CV770_02875 [Bradyrhizobium sp. AC87j1]|nr:hypothetical protein CV770_02875 [Bradyrhizobium sp. AC87j1]
MGKGALAPCQRSINDSREIVGTLRFAYPTILRSRRDTPHHEGRRKPITPSASPHANANDRP